MPSSCRPTSTSMSVLFRICHLIVCLHLFVFGSNPRVTVWICFSDVMNEPVCCFWSQFHHHCGIDHSARIPPDTIGLYARPPHFRTATRRNICIRRSIPSGLPAVAAGAPAPLSAPANGARSAGAEEGAECNRRGAEMPAQRVPLIDVSDSRQCKPSPPNIRSTFGRRKIIAFD